jgi:hypothetical protein
VVASEKQSNRVSAIGACLAYVIDLKFEYFLNLHNLAYIVYLVNLYLLYHLVSL